MESGIYRNLASGEAVVVFGGCISVMVSLNNKDKNGCLKLGVLNKKYAPGDRRDEDDRRDNPQVALYFDNAVSIDILMNGLSYVKDYIQGTPIEELSERYKGYFDALNNEI